jgi:N-methylhydantoinase B/oxoprolinase/acetone carboxylase alpha subunit
MMRNKILALICSIILIPITTFAQSGIEYGKTSELKGLKKVFVDTGGDMKNRERITKEIEKAKLGIELLDSVDGAEIILDFNSGKEKYLASVNTNPQGTVSTPIYRSRNTGEGKVFIVKDNHLRVVMSFEDEERTVFEKKPATNFAKTFIKAYKKATSSKAE